MEHFPESRSPYWHRHLRKLHDHVVSPDNTLREVTGTMPNMKIRHASNSEAIYTDDQLM
uniref:Uncharacterized protein n=1 Tax=Setaria digitata TaxID=48799 RepID=A0A915PJC8_9BILA